VILDEMKKWEDEKLIEVTKAFYKCIGVQYKWEDEVEPGISNETYALHLDSERCKRGITLTQITQ
jgi:hypothetical protein